jgi:outer membrane murein-binding lipoprotein Lpp
MKTLNTMAAMAVAGSVLLLAGSAVGAQVKTLQGETVTMTATIEAIEQSSRTLTVKNDKGNYETIVAPPEMKRFSELKIGDKITMRYYDNVVVRFKKPGEAAIDVDSAALTATSGQRPGGTAATQRTITATVTAIDPKVPSITVKGPNGWTYSRKVVDKKALAQLKVGDQLDITWTDALLISVDAAKK